MYARRATRPKPQRSQSKKWTTPIAGWVANRALADPRSIEGQGAAILDNFFPGATSVKLRRGKQRWATLENLNLAVSSLFSYQNGDTKQLFGANDETIYNLTSVAFPDAAVIVNGADDQIVTENGDYFGWGSTEGLDVGTGYTGGDWSVVQFATTGGVYLVGVNGADTGFLYDGSEFWPNLPGGMWYLPLTSETTAFEQDEIITGGTSGATATVYRDETDRLVISAITELEEEWTLDYDAETADFHVGSTLVGATSHASATIKSISDDGTTGTLTITDLTGSFEDNEAISDGSGGGATADGSESYVTGGSFQAGETITGSVSGEAVVDSPQENAAPGMSFSGSSIDNMAFVWVFKNRLWFAEKGTMNAWYMPIDSVGGEADIFPLGGVFTQGGELLFGSAWSLDSSGSSGLSEQCIFVSSVGEVAVYQGDDPDAGPFIKSGLYRIGAPLGRRAFFRGGGDIAIATSVGLVPLSKAITLDVTALNVATVSYKIADAWSDALTLRGAENWLCDVWPEGKMAVIAPPDIIGASDPVMFISNTETGAWARYTGWFARCMTVFDGKLYFGSDEGQVYIANVGGNDDGETYTGAVMPLYEDFDTPTQLKIGTVGRGRSKANVAVQDKIELKSEFDLTLPVAPNATALSASNTWDSGIWGQSLWGATTSTVVNQDWQSVGGTGYSLSLCYQITSGAVAPIDAELIDLELMYTTTGSVA